MGLVGKIRFAAVPRFIFSSLRLTGLKTSIWDSFMAVCIVSHGLTCIPVNLVLGRLKIRPNGAAPLPRLRPFPFKPNWCTLGTRIDVIFFTWAEAVE